eukprot:m.288819 g.288819  ORF g.288819 m.288819 type:complete len:542 (+) comp12030_c0_seq1:295-1920(+)
MALRNAAVAAGLHSPRTPDLPEEAQLPGQPRRILTRVLRRWRGRRRPSRIVPHSARPSTQRNVQDIVSDMTRRTRLEEAAEHEADGKKSLRERVWDLFEDPESSTWAYFLQAWIVILILLSAVVFCVQTVASQEDVYVWTVLEYIVVINFTLEFVIRFIVCPSKRAFTLSIMNWIDLLAILPFYVELIIKSVNSDSNIGGLAVIRVIRLARVFRLFKLGKHSEQFSLVIRATKKSKDGILLLFFMLGIAVVFFSAAMYYAEILDCFQAADGTWYYKGGPESAENRTPYQSIVHAFWWTIVTLVTVGYGDDVPRTTQGKVVAAACMVVGILVLAFPITLLGASFGEVFAETKEQKIRRKIAGIHRIASKVLSKKRKMSIPQLCRMYREISRDVNDAIGVTRDSYMKIIRALEYYQMATLELQQIVQAIVVAYELDALERASMPTPPSSHEDEIEMDELLQNGPEETDNVERVREVMGLYVSRFRARRASESSGSRSPSIRRDSAERAGAGRVDPDPDTEQEQQIAPGDSSHDPLLMPGQTTN